MPRPNYLNRRKNCKHPLARFPLTAMSCFFLTGSFLASAQEANFEDDYAEEIVILGFKSSLNNAVNKKRFSKNITDHIFSEEIGKSADQNIAEALSRITGISLNRSDGEGASVSIRGAAPNLNNISLNGVILSSGSSPETEGATSSQDIVDLSAFSSDILAGVDIYKTASADLDEGSLGGTVEIRTIRPLAERENRRSFEVQSRFVDFSDGINTSAPDLKISGSFSQKFMDNTLGVHATLFSEEQGGRRDEVEVAGFKATSIASNFVIDQNGNSLERRNADNQIEDITGLEFRRFNVKAFDNNRERIGGTLGIQFAPSSETDVFFSVTHSQQRLMNDNNSLTLSSTDQINQRFSRQAIINFYDRTKNTTLDERYGDTSAWLIADSATPDLNENGDPIDGYQILEPGLNETSAKNWIVFNTETGIFDKKVGRYGLGRNARETRIVDTDNTIASLDIKKLIGDVTLKFKVGYAKTDTGDDLNNRAQSANFINVDKLFLYGVPSDNIQPVGFDCTSGKCRLIAGQSALDRGELPDSKFDNYVATSFNPDDVSSHTLQFLSTRNQFVIDEAISMYLDLDWDVNSLGFTSMETGFKLSDRDKDNVHGFIQYKGFGQDAPGGLTLGRSIPSVNATEVLDGSLGYTNLLSELGYPADNITDGWPSINAEKAFELLNVAAAGDPLLDNKRTRNIRVAAAALYLKGNFAYFDRSLRGDVGLRYVITENDSTGVSGINYEPNTVDIDLFKILTDSANPPCTNRVTDAESREMRDNEARSTPCSDTVLIDNNQRADLYPLDNSTPTNPEFAVRGEGSSGILLPSLNLNYDITEDIVLRAAASKTMARPVIDSLQPGFVYSESLFQGSGSGNIGNPDLQPLESTNVDFALEHYFSDDGGIIGLNFFLKNYSNFEEKETISASLRDVRGLSNAELSELPIDTYLLPGNADPSLCLPFRATLGSGFENDLSRFTDKCRNFQVTRTVNGKGGTIRGLEVNYQQNYEMLPGFWSYFGSAINFTYQKTEADEQEGTFGETLAAFPIAFSPEKSVNATIFWERSGNLVRLAYSYASDVLLSRSSGDGFALWQEGAGSLDLSATLNVSNNIDVTLNAVNLTNRITRQYVTNVSNPTLNEILNTPDGEGSALDGANKSRTVKEFNTGSIYRLGVRVKF